MEKFFKIAGFGLCLLLIGTFAIAGNGMGRGNGMGYRNNQTNENRNIETRQNFVDNNHDGINDNKGTGQRRQNQSGTAMHSNGTRSGARDGSGPINRSGVSMPNYTDANHDGICDNTAK